jgi:hypothetical protein
MRFFKLLNFFLFEFLIASLRRKFHPKFMQNADKSNIRNLTDKSREPSDSRYCQENQNGLSSKSKRGISEEIEKLAQSNADDCGPKIVRSKSDGNARGFEDKNVKLREQAVNIGEKAVNIGEKAVNIRESRLRSEKSVSKHSKRRFGMWKRKISNGKILYWITRRKTVIWKA